MPKTITNMNPDDVVTSLTVPRDGEAIDAGDVNAPFSDLLGNDMYLLTAVHNLSQEVQELRKAQGGFNIAVQSQLPTEPARSYPINVSIGRIAGFAESVTLSVQNLPAGVTAAFDPASVTGSSSVMTIKVDAAAVAGTYDLLLVGESATKTATAHMQINVAAATLTAGFDLALPTQVTIDRAVGTTTLLSINVTRQGGLSDPINFSLVNLPAGLSAEWSSNPVTGSASNQLGATTLKLTASAAVPAGTYSVLLKAVSGSIVVTRSMALTLTALPVIGQPDFALRLVYDAGDPLAINGATLYIDRSNGYAGPVSISVLQFSYGPVILIDGQPWRATVVGNSARITADGAGRPQMDPSLPPSIWTNIKVGWSAVSPGPANFSGSATYGFVTGTAQINSKQVERYAALTWLWQPASKPAGVN